MKSTKTIVRIIALALTATMLALALCSCGSKAVMSFTGENGKTYTITKSEFEFLMVNYKQSFFLSRNLYSAYDTAEYLWDAPISEESDADTFDKLCTDAVKDQARAMLIEEYLFDKYELTLNEDTLKSNREALDTSIKEHGGKGAYKQYYGYTASQYFDFQVLSEKSKAITEYLYGENGIDPVTDAEKETYFNENYSGFQLIMLDMNNKVKVDENGKRLLKTETDSEGVVSETDEYQTETLTDDEADEKQLLPAKLIAQLKEGADFATLAAEYSDDYYSVKYPKGLFVLTDSKFLDDAKAAEAVSALKIGEYTEALSVGDGEYTYIVKRVELVDKVYASDDYKDLFSDYEDSLMYDKYDKVVEAFTDGIVSDDALLGKYSMKTTFLSKYVDYYYKYNQYLSSAS